METQAEKERKRANTAITIAVIAVVLLMAMAAVFFYNWNQEKSVRVDVEAQREQIQKEKNDALAEIESLKGKNVEMDSILRVAQGDIERRSFSIDSILNLKNATSSQLSKARNEISSLRKVIQGYLAQIADLKQQNQQLADSNSRLNNNLEQERSKNNEMSKQNTDLSAKVTTAQKLLATDFKITAFRLKNSGKEVATTKGKRADHVRITFNLAENKVAVAGPRDIFIQVIQPDGTVLYSESQGSNKVQIGNEEIMYSLKSNINYMNTQQEVTATFDKKSDFDKGDYSVAVYVDGLKIAVSSFKLD
jgi:chromosome segregation ATPase